MGRSSDRDHTWNVMKNDTEAIVYIRTNDCWCRGHSSAHIYANRRNICNFLSPSLPQRLKFRKKHLSFDSKWSKKPTMMQ
mmetsp:Transcript_69292/g.103094  ORF Transcript_69292/g.103094 Transcript_69292/m.103094 type:complete len:80 (-) Transcript_69292:95-334(-)